MRRASIILSVLLIFAFSSLSAFAAKPTAAGPELLILVTNWKSVYCNIKVQTAYFFGSEHRDDPCPGPTVIHNPTLYDRVTYPESCTWDVDDAWSKVGEGNISTGQVITATICGISDGTIREKVDAQVLAKHDKLSVRLDGSDGRSWVAVPFRTGSAYLYVMCGDNYIPRSQHAEFPGSNGGWGTLIVYTLTIDATERGANGVRASLKSGQGIESVSACES